MKPFIIYTHAVCNNAWVHTPFTKCYGTTIEEAVAYFCLYMSDKFPALNTYNFCIQQLLPRSDFSGYDPLYGILGVHVQDAITPVIHTVWDHDHA